jgi:hypothetical protein
VAMTLLYMQSRTIQRIIRASRALHQS